LFTGNQGQNAKVKAGAESPAKVHSIAALPKGRDFDGTFEVAGKSYEFAFAPARAAIVERKRLLLTGRVTITGPGGHPNSYPNVRALLASAQGGVGSAPPAYRPAGAAPAAAGSGGHPAPADGAQPERVLPSTDNTGPSSFCGVMYFRLEGVGSLEGLTADLSRVQLNARLYPTDDLARRLHSLYSALVGELSQDHPNQKVLVGMIDDLNHLLKEGAEHATSA
jgi:hypothetical protein